MDTAGLTTAQLVSKFLGTCVIFFVGIMKLPQIYSVLREKSSKGLDLRSLLIEVIGCTIFAAYATITNIPISAYGEVYFLIVQDFILLWAIFYYNKTFGLDVIVPHFLYISFVVMIGMGYITRNIAQSLLLLTIPSPYIAMTLQIMTIRADKSSGTLAPLSFFLGLFTMMARVFTTAVETDDRTLLYNAICLVVMNVILTYYVMRYRDETVKKKD